MIADTFENKCVGRAISTMRAALGGYATGLPDDWPADVEPEVPDIINLVSISFPDRDVKIWCTEKNWHKARTGHCEYMGDYVERGSWSNSYLFAFTYHDNRRGHMVIGWPIMYGDMTLGLVIAVGIAVESEYGEVKP